MALSSSRKLLGSVENSDEEQKRTRAQELKNVQAVTIEDDDDMRFENEEGAPKELKKHDGQNH